MLFRSPEEPRFSLIAREEGSFPFVVGKEFPAFPSHLKKRRSSQERREDRIVQAVGRDGLNAAFAGGPLAAAAEIGANLLSGGRMTELELACDNAVQTYLSSAKRSSYGVESVLGYLAGKETEFTAIRMILTGRLAGVPTDTIRERLRDLYA